MRQWHTGFRSSVALFTALTFTLTSFSYAAPMSTPEVSLPSAALIANSAALRLPSKIATVDAYTPGRGQEASKTILHLQDAHGNFEAHQNMEAVLEHLDKEYGFKTLLVEGASENLEPEIINFFPKDQKHTREVNEKLMHASIVKGFELYLLNHPQSKGYGIENRAAYEENVRQFAAVLAAKDEAGQFLSQMDMEIEKAAAKHLPSELRSFLKRVEKFETNELTLDTYLTELKIAAKKHLEVDLTDAAWQVIFPQLVRVSVIEKLEKEFNGAVFETEQAAFIKIVSSYIGKGDLYKQLKNILSLKDLSANLPDPETEKFFEALVTALPENFKYQLYPNVCKWFGMLILKSEVHAEALIADIEKLENEIGKKYATTPDAEKLLSILVNARLLKKLFALELTPNDFEKIIRGTTYNVQRTKNDKDNNLSVILPSQIAGELSALTGSVPSAARGLPPMVSQLDALFNKALDFYNGARERDQIMLANIEKRLAETNADKVVVVTGGFHALPLQKHFEQMGYSYARVTPKITDLDAEGRAAYLSAMTGFSKMFAKRSSSAVQNSGATTQTVSDTALGVRKEFHPWLKAMRLTVMLVMPVSTQAEQIVTTEQASSVLGGVGASSNNSVGYGAQTAPTAEREFYSKRIEQLSSDIITKPNFQDSLDELKSFASSSGPLFSVLSPVMAEYLAESAIIEMSSLAVVGSESLHLAAPVRKALHQLATISGLSPRVKAIAEIHMYKVEIDLAKYNILKLAHDESQNIHMLKELAGKGSFLLRVNFSSSSLTDPNPEIAARVAGFALDALRGVVLGSDRQEIANQANQAITDIANGDGLSQYIILKAQSLLGGHRSETRLDNAQQERLAVARAQAESEKAEREKRKALVKAAGGNTAFHAKQIAAQQAAAAATKSGAGAQQPVAKKPAAKAAPKSTDYAAEAAGYQEHNAFNRKGGLVAKLAGRDVAVQEELRDLWNVLERNRGFEITAGRFGHIYLLLDDAQKFYEKARKSYWGAGLSLLAIPLAFLLFGQTIGLVVTAIVTFAVIGVISIVSANRHPILQTPAGNNILKLLPLFKKQVDLELEKMATPDSPQPAEAGVRSGQRVDDEMQAVYAQALANQSSRIAKDPRVRIELLVNKNMREVFLGKLKGEESGSVGQEARAEMRAETREDVVRRMRAIILVKQLAKSLPDSDKDMEALRLQEDMNVDSMDSMEFVMAVEDEFNIEVPKEKAEELKTVGQWIDYVDGVVNSRREARDTRAEVSAKLKQAIVNKLGVLADKISDNTTLKSLRGTEAALEELAKDFFGFWSGQDAQKELTLETPFKGWVDYALRQSRFEDLKLIQWPPPLLNGNSKVGDFLSNWPRIYGYRDFGNVSFWTTYDELKKLGFRVGFSELIGNDFNVLKSLKAMNINNVLSSATPKEHKFLTALGIKRGNDLLNLSLDDARAKGIQAEMLVKWAEQLEAAYRGIDDQQKNPKQPKVRPSRLENSLSVLPSGKSKWALEAFIKDRDEDSVKKDWPVLLTKPYLISANALSAWEKALRQRDIELDIRHAIGNDKAVWQQIEALPLEQVFNGYLNRPFAKQNGGFSYWNITTVKQLLDLSLKGLLKQGMETDRDLAPILEDLQRVYSLVSKTSTLRAEARLSLNQLIKDSLKDKRWGRVQSDDAWHFRERAAVKGVKTTLSVKYNDGRKEKETGEWEINISRDKEAAQAKISFDPQTGKFTAKELFDWDGDGKEEDFVFQMTEAPQFSVDKTGNLIITVSGKEFEQSGFMEVQLWLKKANIWLNTRSEARRSLTRREFLRGAGAAALLAPIAQGSVVGFDPINKTITMNVPYAGTYRLMGSATSTDINLMTSRGTFTATGPGNVVVSIPSTAASIQNFAYQFISPDVPKGWTAIASNPNFATQTEHQQTTNPSTGKTFITKTVKLMNLRTSVQETVFTWNYEGSSVVNYEIKINVSPSGNHYTVSSQLSSGGFSQSIAVRTFGNPGQGTSVGSGSLLATADWTKQAGWVEITTQESIVYRVNLATMEVVLSEEEIAYNDARDNFNEMKPFIYGYIHKRGYVEGLSGWVSGVAKWYTPPVIPAASPRPFREFASEFNSAKLTQLTTTQHLWSFKSAQVNASAMGGWIYKYLTQSGYAVDSVWLNGFAPHYAAPLGGNRPFEEFVAEINGLIARGVIRRAEVRNETLLNYELRLLTPAERAMRGLTIDLVTLIVSVIVGISVFSLLAYGPFVVPAWGQFTGLLVGGSAAYFLLRTSVTKALDHIYLRAKIAERSRTVFVDSDIAPKSSLMGSRAREKVGQRARGVNQLTVVASGVVAILVGLSTEVALIPKMGIGALIPSVLLAFFSYLGAERVSRPLFNRLSRWADYRDRTEGRAETRSELRESVTISMRDFDSARYTAPQHVMAQLGREPAASKIKLRDISEGEYTIKVFTDTQADPVSVDSISSILDVLGTIDRVVFEPARAETRTAADYDRYAGALLEWTDTTSEVSVDISYGGDVVRLRNMFANYKEGDFGRRMDSYGEMAQKNSLPSYDLSRGDENGNLVINDQNLLDAIKRVQQRAEMRWTREMVADKVKEIVAEQLGVQVEKVTEIARLEELGASASHLVGLETAFEDGFDIQVNDDNSSIKTKVGTWIDYIYSLVPRAETRLTDEQEATLQEAKIVFNLTDEDAGYLRALWLQHLYPNAGEMLKISSGMEDESGNFVPTSTLSDAMQAALGVLKYASIAEDSSNADEAAQNVILTVNSMDGGIGESLNRLKWLRKNIDPKAQMGAKGTDLGFYISNDSGEFQFISVAEAKLMQLIDIAEAKKFKAIQFEPLVNYQSRGSYEKLFQTPYFRERGKTNARTYAQALTDAGVKILDMRMQADLPAIDAKTNSVATDPKANKQPGGHGYWGFLFLWQMFKEKIVKGAVRVFMNGDNPNSAPNPAIAGYVLKNNIPVAMLTTVATPIDDKGGKMGLRRVKITLKEEVNGELKDVTKTIYVKSQMELGDAKAAGQQQMFQDIGLAGGIGREGQQDFNTNIIYFNEYLLHEILNELAAIIGEAELAKVISPYLIKKPAKDASDKDLKAKGVKYIPMDGAIGVNVHRLNEYFAVSADPKVREILEKRGLTQLLYYIRVPRTEFFTPVKVTTDMWMQSYTDYYRFNRTTMRLEESQPGLTPPNFDLKGQINENGKMADYWTELQNVVDSFGKASVVGLKSLSVDGLVSLTNDGKSSPVLRGDVVIRSSHKTPFNLHAAVLASKDLQKRFGYQEGKPLVLDNVTVDISDEGVVSVVPRAESRTDFGVMRKEMMPFVEKLGLDETDVEYFLAMLYQHRVAASGAASAQKKIGKTFWPSAMLTANQTAQHLNEIQYQDLLAYVAKMANKPKVAVQFNSLDGGLGTTVDRFRANLLDAIEKLKLSEVQELKVVLNQGDAKTELTVKGSARDMLEVMVNGIDAHNKAGGSRFDKDARIDFQFSDAASGDFVAQSFVMIRAKGIDLPFDIVVNGKKMRVTVAEIKAHRMYLEGKDYHSASFRPLVNEDSAPSYEEFLDQPYFYDVAHDVATPRTYRELLSEGNLSVVERKGFVMQQKLPNIRTVDGQGKFAGEKAGDLTIERTAPANHGQLGFRIVVDILNRANAIIAESERTGVVQIEVFQNGDNASSTISSEMAHYIADQKTPMMIVSTDKAPVDMKGGQIGIEAKVNADGSLEGVTINADGTITIAPGAPVKVTIMEKAEAQKSGDLVRFFPMGIDEKFGLPGRKQSFNTNVIVFNATILAKLLKELENVLGRTELLKRLSPDNISEEKKNSAGQPFYQLGGAISSLVFNLNSIFTLADATTDEGRKIQAIHHGSILSLMNLGLADRSKFFAPIKTSVDYALLNFMNFYGYVEGGWLDILESARLSELPQFTLGEEDATGEKTAVGKKTDAYYKDTLNARDAFIGVTPVNLDFQILRGFVELPGARLEGTVVIRSDFPTVFNLTESQAPALMPYRKDGRLELANVNLEISREGVVSVVPRAETREDINLSLELGALPKKISDKRYRVSVMRWKEGDEAGYLVVLDIPMGKRSYFITAEKAANIDPKDSDIIRALGSTVRLTSIDVDTVTIKFSSRAEARESWQLIAPKLWQQLASISDSALVGEGKTWTQFVAEHKIPREVEELTIEMQIQIRETLNAFLADLEKVIRKNKNLGLADQLTNVLAELRILSASVETKVLLEVPGGGSTRRDSNEIFFTFEGEKYRFRVVQPNLSGLGYMYKDAFASADNNAVRFEFSNVAQQGVAMFSPYHVERASVAKADRADVLKNGDRFYFKALGGQKILIFTLETSPLKGRWGDIAAPVSVLLTLNDNPKIVFSARSETRTAYPITALESVAAKAIKGFYDEFHALRIAAHNKYVAEHSTEARIAETTGLRALADAQPQEIVVHTNDQGEPVSVEIIFEKILGVATRGTAAPFPVSSPAILIDLKGAQVRTARPYGGAEVFKVGDVDSEKVMSLTGAQKNALYQLIEQPIQTELDRVKDAHPLTRSGVSIKEYSVDTDPAAKLGTTVLDKISFLRSESGVARLAGSASAFSEFSMETRANLVLAQTHMRKVAQINLHDMTNVLAIFNLFPKKFSEETRATLTLAQIYMAEGGARMDLYDTGNVLAIFNLFSEEFSEKIRAALTLAQINMHKVDRIGLYDTSRVLQLLSEAPPTDDRRARAEARNDIEELIYRRLNVEFRASDVVVPRAESRSELRVLKVIAQFTFGVVRIGLLTHAQLEAIVGQRVYRSLDEAFETPDYSQSPSMAALREKVIASMTEEDGVRARTLAAMTVNKPMNLRQLVGGKADLTQEFAEFLVLQLKAGFLGQAGRIDLVVPSATKGDIKAFERMLAQVANNAGADGVERRILISADLNTLNRAPRNKMLTVVVGVASFVAGMSHATGVNRYTTEVGGKKIAPPVTAAAIAILHARTNGRFSDPNTVLTIDAAAKALHMDIGNFVEILLAAMRETSKSA